MDMRISWICLLLIILYLNADAISNQSICPKQCSCKTIPQRGDSQWFKLRCGDSEKISHFNDLDLKNISSEILQLNLSHNSLTEFLPKLNLVALQKLDLSNNKLSTLFNNQFIQIPNLKRLDISNNGLKRIEYAAFFSLKYLERLKLYQNQLSSFSAGTFEPLKNLKHLDISENPLVCDCLLMYAVQWMENNSVKMLNNPKCQSPQIYKGVFIRKLRIGIDISCPHITLTSNNTTEPPNLTPIPTSSAISVQLRQHPAAKQLNFVNKQQSHIAVLEGDEFTLHCKAVYTENYNKTDTKNTNKYIGKNNINIADVDDVEGSAELQWTWLDSDPTKVFSDVRIEDDGDGVGSMVRVGRVRRAHAGVWKCALVGKGANEGDEVHTRLLVMGACPSITVPTRGKGTYHFPPTPPSTTARQPCTVQTPPSSTTATPSTIAMATVYCNSSGYWQTESSRNYSEMSDAFLGPNVSTCGWLSERTRVLQQFAQLQLQFQNSRSLIDSLMHFHNYTKQAIKRGDHERDTDGSVVMDFVFSVRTIANFAKELHSDTEYIAGQLLDIINSLLELPDDLLATAQKEDNSCLKLLEVLRIITNLAPSSVHKTNVAMEAFPVKPESFAGLTCSWLQQHDSVGNGGRFFQCTAAPNVHSGHGNQSNNNITVMTNINNNNNRQMLASIQVPPSLFYQLHQLRLLQRPSSKSGIDGNTSSLNIIMTTERIRVAMFSGGGLFPMATEEIRSVGNHSILKEEITSPAIGFAIDNLTLHTITLTEPILLLILAAPAPHCVTPPRPVWYDSSTRRWSIQGCHALNHYRNNAALVFQCRQLGVYALQQTCKSVGTSGANGNRRSAVKEFDTDEVVVLSWVMTGTIVLWLGLGGGIYGMWLLGRKRWYRTMVPVRARHALINSWIALAFLSALFTVVMIFRGSTGRTIDGRQICTALGVLIHYLTLCILLWMCVGINALHQRLRKRIALIRTRGNLAILRLNTDAGQVIVTATDNEQDEAPATTIPARPSSTAPPSTILVQTTPSATPPPPLLSIYLIGWGVAALLCGISAAVTVREYNSASSTCPLPLFPSVSDNGLERKSVVGGVTVMVWAPYVALTIIIIGMTTLVRVRCGKIRWLLDGRNGLSRMSEGDGTQATEQVDLELLEPPPTVQSPAAIIINPSTPTSISSSHNNAQHHQLHRWRATSSCIATALASNSSDQSTDSDQSDVDTAHRHHNRQHNYSSTTSNSQQEQQCACCDPNVEWRAVQLRVVHLLLMVVMVVCCGGVLIGGDATNGWSISYAVMASTVGMFALGIACVWSGSSVRKARSSWSAFFKRTSSHSPIFTPSIPTSAQRTETATPQPCPLTSVAIHAIRPVSSSNNSNTSNKQLPQPQFANGNIAVPSAANANANDTALQLQTLLIVDNSQPPGVKITNIEAAAARGQQYIVGGMPNIIENCTQSADMFYNPHQSFVARRFFRKQKQQRSMQKRNNMMFARQQQDQSHNDGDIFAGNSSKVNNTNIHTELLDITNGGASGRSRGNRRRNLNILCDNTEEDAIIDKGKHRDKEKDRDRYRYGHHKKRQNNGSDIDPLQMQPQQLNMMRTVSQQCTLKYSSDNIIGEIDFEGTAATLDKSVGANPTEPTYCNVVEMKMQIAAFANAAAIGPPDGTEKDNKSSRIFINPMHDMYPIDSMEHCPPDLLLTHSTLDRNTSTNHLKTTSIDQQTIPSTDKLLLLSSPLLLDTPTVQNTHQSTSATTITGTVSCSSVCPSELDELYQQIRGSGGINHTGYGSRRVGKSRSQIVLLDEDQRCSRLDDGDDGWLQQQQQHHQWQSDSEVNNGYYVDYRDGKERRRKKKDKGETRL